MSELLPTVTFRRISSGSLHYEIIVQGKTIDKLSWEQTLRLEKVLHAIGVGTSREYLGEEPEES